MALSTSKLAVDVLGEATAGVGVSIINPLHLAGAPLFDVTHPTYGAIADSVTDNKVAIDAALAAAAVKGGVVYFPAAVLKYTTSGNHTVAAGVTVMGDGAFASILEHTGNNTCFSAVAQSTAELFYQRRFYGLRIEGNSGASAIAISISHLYRAYLEDVIVWDYTGGCGIEIKNSVIAAVGLFTEGTTFMHVHVRNCLIGWRFTRDTSNSGTISFGETRFYACSCVLYTASSIGITIPDTGSFVYGGIWHIKFNAQATGGTLINVGAGALVQDVELALFAEITSPATSAIKLVLGSSASTFFGYGEFTTSGTYTESITGSPTYFIGQKSGKHTVGQSGEYHLTTANTSWAIGTADADLVVAFNTTGTINGLFNISWTGTGRAHSMLFRVGATGGDTTPTVSVVDEWYSGGQKVFGTPKIQRLSSGGGVPHVVIPVANRNAATGDIRLHLIASQSFPYQWGIFQGAAGALAAADVAWLDFPARVVRLTADNTAIAAGTPTTGVAVANLQFPIFIGEEWDIEWSLYVANSVATDVFVINVVPTAGTFTGRVTLEGQTGVPTAGAGVVKILEGPAGTITTATANAPGATGTIGLVTRLLVRAQGKQTVANGTMTVQLRAGTNAAVSSGTATVKLQSQMIARRVG